MERGSTLVDLKYRVVLLGSAFPELDAVLSLIGEYAD